MPRNLTRAGSAVLLAALAATLVACAPDPDLTSLEDELSDAPGVHAVEAWPQHSNFPWETQINVRLYVDDASAEALTATVRAIAPALAEDPAASRFWTYVSFSQDEPGDTYTPVVDVQVEGQLGDLGLDGTGSRLIFKEGDAARLTQQ